MEGKAGRGLGLIPLPGRVSGSPVVTISSAENYNHSDVTERVYIHTTNHRLHEPPADVWMTTRNSCSHTKTLRSKLNLDWLNLTYLLFFSPPNIVTKYGLVF